MMKLVLCLALLFLTAAKAEGDHVYWRKLAILSQSDQIGYHNQKYYLVVGNSLSAESIIPARVCDLLGLNGAIYQASEAEIYDVLSAIRSKPDLVVVVGPMRSKFDASTVLIEDSDDQGKLSQEISKQISAARRC
jgi:hypothetical protein